MSQKPRNGGAPVLAMQPARDVWQRLATWNGCDAVDPVRWQPMTNSTLIVAKIINDTSPVFRKAVNSLILLTLWEIWRERNDCTFRGKVASASQIVSSIRRAIELWRAAGATCLEPPFGETLGDM